MQGVQGVKPCLCAFWRLPSWRQWPGRFREDARCPAGCRQGRRRAEFPSLFPLPPVPKIPYLRPSASPAGKCFFSFLVQCSLRPLFMGNVAALRLLRGIFPKGVSFVLFVGNSSCIPVWTLERFGPAWRGLPSDGKGRQDQERHFCKANSKLRRTPVRRYERQKGLFCKTNPN